MIAQIFIYISYFQTALSAFVVILSWYKYSTRSNVTKLIGLLFFWSFACNVGGYIFVVLKHYKFQNYPGILYGFITLIVTAVIYHHATQLKYLRMISGTTTIVFVATFINLFFFQKDSYSTYNDLLVSFVIICCAVFYLYRLMVELPTSQVHALPMFWFNSGFLFYHAGAFFLFAFSSYLINVLRNDMWIYWIFHNLLDIIQHFIILVGLYYDLSRRDQLIAPSLSLPK